MSAVRAIRWQYFPAVIVTCRLGPVRVRVRPGVRPGVRQCQTVSGVSDVSAGGGQPSDSRQPAAGGAARRQWRRGDGRCSGRPHITSRQVINRRVIATPSFYRAGSSHAPPQFIDFITSPRLGVELSCPGRRVFCLPAAGHRTGHRR